VVVTLLTTVRGVDAHPAVSQASRAGAYPAYDGGGWIGEVFLNIPDESAIHLLTAETYIADRQPDFTFRTEWIDFPAGPVAFQLDSDFATMGDFLNA